MSLLRCTQTANPAGDGGVDGGGDATTIDASKDAATADGPTPNDASQPDAALVSACQSLASNFATKCGTDAPRPCAWAAYVKLCATGQPQLLIDSMSCLDSTLCRLLSDPNEGQACLETVHTNEQSTTAKSFLASFCTRCGGSNCSSVQATVEILPYLTDADLTELTSCAATACTLPEVLSACPNVANLQLFASCSLFTF
ncbi:MAG TPA: hypothetical protein VH054_09710 [Polyangiaceae bacterium]|nr:hypothetical protein [Polyangiaceae bacterium]